MRDRAPNDRKPKPSIASSPGGAAELLVERVLVERGWTIVGRRWRIGRLEIDLLARRDDVIAVVEVRGRRDGGLETAFDSVDATKRARLARAARRVWSRFADDATVRIVRIDLASVTWRAGEAPTIEIAEGGVDLGEA